MNPVFILILAVALLFMVAAWKNQTPTSLVKTLVAGVYAPPAKAS